MPEARLSNLILRNLSRDTVLRVLYFQIYDLRSTFATRLSAGGVPESFVMDLLGHSDPSAMKRYSFARMGQLQEAVGRLNRRTGEDSSQRNPDILQ